MTRGKWLALAVLVAVAAGSATTWALLRRAKSAESAPAAVATTASAGEITLMGNVAPRDAVLVAAPVEGILEVLEVPVGGEVLMGQIIGRLINKDRQDASDSAEEQLTAARERVANTEVQLTAARLEAARAAAEATATQGDMDRARAAAERQEILFKEGATARNTYEQAKKDAAARVSEYTLLRESARAAEERAKTLAGDLDAAKKAVENQTKAIETATANLRMGEVVSPMDGVLTSSKVVPGDMVPEGTKDLFSVAPNALRLAVLLEPDPSAAAVLRDGLEAQVTLATLPDSPYPAHIVRTQDGRWEAQFETPELVWRPGDQASVRIRLP